MSYHKPTHTYLQQLIAKAKRAHRWAMIQPMSRIVPCASHIHHGTAY